MDTETKNYKLFHLISEEFEDYLKNLQGLFLDSLLGYQLIKKELENEKDFLKKVMPAELEIISEEFQSQISFSHEQLFGESMSTAGLFFHKKREVKERLKKGGHNHQYIGLVVIIALNTYWEECVRDKVAKAYGKKKEEYKDDFWGDLRLFRNALVHKNKKTADKFRNAARMEFFQKIAQKETITLTPKIIWGIFLLAYTFKNSIFYESLPKNTIRIPKFERHNT